MTGAAQHDGHWNWVERTRLPMHRLPAILFAGRGEDIGGGENLAMAETDGDGHGTGADREPAVGVEPGLAASATTDPVAGLIADADRTTTSSASSAGSATALAEDAPLVRWLAESAQGDRAAFRRHRHHVRHIKVTHHIQEDEAARRRIGRINWQFPCATL